MNETRRTLLKGAGAVLAAPALGSAYAQAEPLRIGVLQSLSGSLAIIGQTCVAGAKIAAKQINAAGGVNGRPIELVIRDTKTSANDTVTAARELAGMGINLFMGETLSAPNLALVPLAKPLNSVVVFTGALAMEFTHELFSPNVFRAASNGRMLCFAQMKLMLDQHPDIKRWATLVSDTAGNRFAVDLWHAGLKKTASEKGITIELLEPVVAKLGAMDYRTQVTQLMAQKPQGLLLAAAGGEAMSFLQQAKPYGLLDSVQAIADYTLATKIGDALKRQTPRNFWSAHAWSIEDYQNNPLAQAWQREASAELKTPMIDQYATLSHLVITTLVEGVRNAKSTNTDQVIRAIETMKYDTVFGPMQFRKEDHQLRISPAFLRIGPDNSEKGWKVFDSVRVPAEQVMEPAAPGQKYQMGV